MANEDIVVTYDPVLEMAAIVDTQNRIGFGPAYIGPNANTVLEAFLDSIAYDVTEVDSAVLRDWFEQFAAVFPAPTTAETGTPVTGAVVDSPPTSVADETALAEHTATNTTETPAPAPADTDMEADAGKADTVTTDGPTELPPESEPPNAAATYDGPCPACSGTGSVPGSEGAATLTCNLCHGTGHFVATPAPQ